MTLYYGLIVAKHDIYAVKTFLESCSILNKKIAIQKCSECSEKPEFFVITTLIEASTAFVSDPNGSSTHEDTLRSILSDFGLSDILPQSIRDSIQGITSMDYVDSSHPSRTGNRLYSAFKEAFRRCPPCSSPSLALSADKLVRALPKRYCIYPPMLLLPSHAFSHTAWKQTLKWLEEHPDAKPRFFSIIAQQLRITHIAINAPIPTNIQSDGKTSNTDARENLLRSPTDLQPLFGDFGRNLPEILASNPTHRDFTNAFWVSTCQNGISQVWAPRYTMFSSGNVTEKARILHLESVHAAVSQGQESGSRCTVVDLFAGIGYFAFSYAKAGVAKILCWDLNPWSVEGLRRGAASNKWSCRTVAADRREPFEAAVQSYGDIDPAICNGPEQFLLFEESNVHAEARIPVLRAHLPPIRHVNCGMLPSVGHAWKTAVQALDPRLGGWLHLHETIGESEGDARINQITDMVADYVKKWRESVEDQPAAEVVLEHVEKVKSIGPRLWHLVLDIRVSPRHI